MMAARVVMFSVSPVPAPPSIESKLVKVITPAESLPVNMSLPKPPTNAVPVSIPAVSGIAFEAYVAITAVAADA